MRRFYALHGHWHAKRQGKTMNEIRSAFERSTKKAVIYARFSTDLQNERSIEDQITLCRDYASREGMNVVEVYEDRARSGGSIMGRGGLLHLLDHARERSFDVVVVEALDRLSRDMTSPVFTSGFRSLVSKYELSTKASSTRSWLGFADSWADTARNCTRLEQ